jgi:hypothetical protein
MMLCGIILTLAAMFNPASSEPEMVSIIGIGQQGRIASADIDDGRALRWSNPAAGLATLTFRTYAQERVVGRVVFDDDAEWWFGVERRAASARVEASYPDGPLYGDGRNADGQLVSFGFGPDAHEQARAWAAEPIGREPLHWSVYAFGAAAFVAVGLVWARRRNATPAH